MKRYLKATKHLTPKHMTSNAEFNHWYLMLSRPEQERVDDLMEHNCFDYDRASDVELSWIKDLYTDMVEEEESSKDSEDILDEVKVWASNYRIKRFQKFNKYGLSLEKHSIEDLIHDYISWFNKEIREGRNGFESWDPDDTMHILYKNGRIRTISPQSDDGTKKISIDNIDSIIVLGSWGDAFAGPSVTFEDYTVYDDIVDIRPEFTYGR